MSLRLHCPDCGKALPLSQDAAKRPLRCPVCGRLVSSWDATRPSGITTRPQPPPLVGEEPSVGGPLALVVAITTVVLGVAALGVSWLPSIWGVSLALGGVGLILAVVGVVVALIHPRGLVLGLSLGGAGVNILALVLAIVTALLSKDPADSVVPGAEPSTATEPQAGATLPGWGQVYDPDGDCTCTLERDGLWIRIPPTAHDLSVEIGQVNAPRVLQEVEGDFTARVKVCGVIRPTAAAAVFGRTPFQSGGLLLYSSSGSYVRLERAALRRGEQVLSYASLEQRSNGNVVLPPASTPLPDEDVILRLERQGNQVTGYVSVAGNKEISLGPITVDFPARARVGVAAVNAAEQPLAVRFEQFTVQKK